MKLVADDVQRLVVPGFLAPGRDEHGTRLDNGSGS